MITVFLRKQLACPVSLSPVKKIILIAARQEKKIKGEVEVVIVGDKAMKDLNCRYRQKDKVTDVLSFAWQEDKKIPSQGLGQIYLCYPQIRRQAKEYGVPVKKEFARMLVHGLLHLVGYDHQTPREEKKMFNLQEKILTSVIANPDSHRG